MKKGYEPILRGGVEGEEKGKECAKESDNGGNDDDCDGQPKVFTVPFILYLFVVALISVCIGLQIGQLVKLL